MFELDNLPYGVFSLEPTGEKRLGTRLGDNVFDILAAYDRQPLGEVPRSVLTTENWNAFAALPSAKRRG